NRVQMYRSFDNGQTFTAPVNATPGFVGFGDFQDKEWITADNFSGPGQGNVYLAWRHFSNTSPGAGIPYGVRFTRSTDGGATWGPNQGLLIAAEGAFNVQGANVLVGPDHSVYVFWLDQSAGAGTPNIIKVRKSTNQGVSFAAAVNVATLVATGVNGDLGLNGGFRTAAFPQAVVNPVSGHIYLTFPDATSGADRADVFLVKSTDGGVTWSAKQRINDDATINDQFFPTLAVTPNGNSLFLTFYDRRLDPANSLIDRFGVIGSISGSAITFSGNFRITTQSFPVVIGQDPVINPSYMGDYDQAQADNSFFYTTWGDNRNPSTAHAHQPDVFFAKIPVTGPGAQLAFGAATISGGNGNGVVDFNECNDLSVSINNTGTSAATGVSATLTSSTPGVTIIQANSAYPNIAASSSGANLVAFKVQTTPGFVCGTAIDCVLNVTTVSDGPFTIAFKLSSGLSAPSTFTSTDVPKAILDVNTINSINNVSGLTGPIGKVTASVYLTHTFDGDLIIRLIGPDGTTIDLSNRNGGAGDNYGTGCNSPTIFDDAAGVAINSGAAPFAGTFRPQQALSAFNGKSGAAANGVWKLSIQDAAAIDTGTLICWSVSISQSVCTDGGGPCGGTTRTLTVASSNPNNGVSVTASPNDNNGQGTGTTQFTRTYNNNQVVNLVAPSTAGGNIFSKWQRDGVDWSTVPATSVTMDLNHTMTAIYLTPTWTLTVASSNPNSGVSVTVNPNDNNAQGNGNTQFTRTYNNNAVVNLTAPASSGGNIFSKWQRDGVDWSTVPATSVTMDLNHTMTAIYVLPTWILTVASSNPNSGVSVTVSPNDNNAQGNGVTQFTRTYNNNVVVNLTAPAIAGGNNFVKWQRDGVDWATTAATSVTMDANHTMAAIYAAPSGTTDFVTGTTPGTLRNDFSGFAGMKITVGISPVTVTDLGRYKFSGNTGTHLVKLVNVATGVDVAGVSALVNLGTGASGQFNYASLATPVMLPANTSYYLVAQETAGGDQLASFNTIVTATSVAAVNGSVNQSGTSWIFRATANTTIGPVSFKYSTGALNLPPSVSLTAPANSATFTAGTNIPINATATDSDGSVSKVDFFANNTLIGTATAGVGNVYSITWNNVVANNYALTAVATDNLNANTTSSPVNITVNPAIDPTLVGYWKLDDASGLSAVDSSGNGNTGALVNGPVWSAGATSGALSFDGVDSYVDLGNGANLNPATAITLVAWVKANSTAATSGLIIKDNGTSHQYALWLQLGGKVRLSIGAAVLTGTTTVTTGAWHQLAGTYDGTQLKIYLDGALEGTLAASGTMSNNGVNARLGGRQYPANPLTLNGALDAARIYNRALSQSEIQALTP
ncbi:MAG: proprotein convertase P-domain-containing protein, partial [Verrucomicrobia bacterium]|nr:proprotein convertase P-domain-containing protein [Verrucomicrobiota bacterium]